MNGLGRYPATVVMLALAVACGGPQPTIPPEFRVTPDESLVPKRGGADMPAVAISVLKECDQGLQDGEYEALARSMNERAKQAPDPETAAISQACGGVAKINIGAVDAGLTDIGEAEQRIQGLPEPARGPLEEMLYRAQVVGYAAIGDKAGVRRAIAKLSQVDPEKAKQYAEKCELLKPAGSRLPCKPPEQPESPPGGSSEVTTTPPPSSPSGEPTLGTSSPERSPERKPSSSEQPSRVEPRPEPQRPMPDES